MMKFSLSILFFLFIASSLSGCNTMKTHSKSASACEQGIDKLNRQLSAKLLSIHKTNVNRANSLLVSAQVQYQFAEYPACLEKVKRAQDYLTGRQTAVISRLIM